MITWLKSLLTRPPKLAFGRNGPPLDPRKRYAFTVATNFATRHAADLCALALNHLNLAVDVSGLANGRWNVDFTFTMLAEPNAIGRVYNAIDDAAQRQGGDIFLCTVGLPPADAPG